MVDDLDSEAQNMIIEPRAPETERLTANVVGTERVTLDEAFEKVGGFGKF